MSGPASPTHRFKIMLLNDDYTPMEFVVAVLEDIFKMNREEATLAMLNTHRQGRHAVATLGRRQQRRQDKPLSSGQIAWVAQFVPVMLCPGLGGPHRRLQG
jgi:hypothetical protein